jgi:dUTP pyrophosphatase
MKVHNDIKIFFNKLNKKARTPEYKHGGDSGADLFAVDDFEVKAGEIYLAHTGISISLVVGIEAQIRPRSGLALKGLSIVNSPSTIDSGYRGELKVPLINLGKEDILIKGGERFAQIVFAPVFKGHFIEVEELSGSDRDSGGFGSTGL